LSDNDIKTDYLQGLMKMDIPRLTTKEEHELARLIGLGDDQALEKLVYHNLPFVPHVVTKMTAWQHGKTPLEDIIAIGNEMLFVAAKRWKPHKNVPFAGYARPFIERGVRRELDNTSNTIRLPINIMEELKRMNYNERTLSQVLGRKPTVAELATIVGVSATRIHQLKGYISREPISLDNLNNENLQEESEE
jgi:DNA-directed RNA polymerase sigma subunit (sigma70/sigma32)